MAMFNQIAQPTRVEREPYVRPKLTEIGKVAAATFGNSRTNTDGGGGHSQP